MNAKIRLDGVNVVGAPPMSMTFSNLFLFGFGDSLLRQTEPTLFAPTNATADESMNGRFVDLLQSLQ